MPEEVNENQNSHLDIPHPMSAKTRKFLRHVRSAVEQNLPISGLTPEAHEDALKAGRTLWTETMKYLHGSEYGSLISHDGQHWAIFNPKIDKNLDLIPGADLLITTSQADFENVNGEEVNYLNAKNYYLTPGGTFLIEKNSGSAIVSGKTEPRPPKQTGIIKEEIGRDEINKLTDMIKSGNSETPLKDRGVHVDSTGTEEAIKNLRNEINGSAFKKFLLGMRRRLLK